MAGMDARTRALSGYAPTFRRITALTAIALLAWVLPARAQADRAGGAAGGRAGPAAGGGAGAGAPSAPAGPAHTRARQGAARRRRAAAKRRAARRKKERKQLERRI